MLKLTQYLAISGILLSSILTAQHEKCASSLMQDRLINEQEGYAEQIIKNEKQIQSIIARKKRSKTTEDVLTIPVVIHVVHLGESIGVGNNISDAQITSGITQLNEAFSNGNGQGVDIKIAFKLAVLDPNCTSTSGILRVDGSGVSGYLSDGVSLGTVGADEVTIKELSIWPNTEYYNIWLVSEFDGNDGGGGTQGFAYFPNASAPKDGAMIMNTAWGSEGTVNSWNNKGTTGIHEIGHALDLYHTFEGDEDALGVEQCPPGPCGKFIGDCCDDTSPHKRSSSDCATSATNTCTGLTNDDVINNYMDYSSQTCTVKFTADQKDRMRAALEGPRGSLLSSKALSSSLPVFSAPVSASCTPVSSTDGTCPIGCGFSGIMLAEITDVVSHVTSYTPGDGGYIDESGSCIKTAILIKEGTYQFKTQIWLNSGHAVAWIDYNNDGSFSSSEKIYENTNIAGNTDDSASFTLPASATLNTYLRMRVMCDVSNTVSSACHNPQYGQAEDYAVLIQNPTSVASEIESLVNLVVAPNPFKDQLSVLNNKGTLSYTIIDITGRTVLSGVVSGAEPISTSTVLDGSYVIVLQNKEGVTSKKLIK